MLILILDTFVAALQTAILRPAYLASRISLKMPGLGWMSPLPTKSLYASDFQSWIISINSFCSFSFEGILSKFNLK